MSVTLGPFITALRLMGFTLVSDKRRKDGRRVIFHQKRGYLAGSERTVEVNLSSTGEHLVTHFHGDSTAVTSPSPFRDGYSMLSAIIKESTRKDGVMTKGRR